MSCIIYMTNKKTNTKYAYRSESYRDPVTKKPKSRRTYLGRVDPDTNEIIPKAEKGKRNRCPIGTHTSNTNNLHESENGNLTMLKKQVKVLQKKQDELKEIVSDVDDAISEMYSLISRI